MPPFLNPWCQALQANPAPRTNKNYVHNNCYYHPSLPSLSCLFFRLGLGGDCPLLGLHALLSGLASMIAVPAVRARHKQVGVRVRLEQVKKNTVVLAATLPSDGASGRNSCSSTAGEQVYEYIRMVAAVQEKSKGQSKTTKRLHRSKAAELSGMKAD